MKSILEMTHKFHRTFPKSCLGLSSKEQNLKVFDGSLSDDTRADDDNLKVDLGLSSQVLEVEIVVDHDLNIQALVAKIVVVHGGLHSRHFVELFQV